MRLDPQHRTEARRIAAEVAAICRTGMVLPGTVMERRMRCGRAGCKCRADPPQPHGPYWAWTRKVKAKTVGRWLTDEQRDEYQPWFDNARRLRALMSELEAMSVAAVERDPRWLRPGSTATPPTRRYRVNIVDNVRRAARQPARAINFRARSTLSDPSVKTSPETSS